MGEVVSSAMAGTAVTPAADTLAQLAAPVPQRQRRVLAVTLSGLVTAVTRPNASWLSTVTRPFASVTRFGTPKRWS